MIKSDGGKADVDISFRDLFVQTVRTERVSTPQNNVGSEKKD